MITFPNPILVEQERLKLELEKATASMALRVISKINVSTVRNFRWQLHNVFFGFALLSETQTILPWLFHLKSFIIINKYKDNSVQNHRIIIGGF